MSTANIPTRRLRRLMIVAAIAVAAAPGAARATVEPTGAPGRAAADHPEQIAAVTQAGDVILVDGRDGSFIQRIFRASDSTTPEDPGNGAYTVERAADGTVYYETGPEPAVGAIWRYEPSTNRRELVMYGRAPALNHDIRRLAVARNGGVAVRDLRTGDELEYTPRTGAIVRDVAWNDATNLVVSFAPAGTGGRVGLGQLDLISGRWTYPTGADVRLLDAFDPSLRRRGTVVALRNRQDPFEMKGDPIGLRVVQVGLSRNTSRTLATGRFRDVSTSDDGRWVVAARLDRALTIVGPSGDVAVVEHPTARRVIDLDR